MRNMLGMVLFFLLLPTMTIAQSNNSTNSDNDYKDVVLLENRAVIHGKIIEKIEGDKVVIERKDGQVFKIPWWRVLLISTEDKFEEEKKTAIAIQPKNVSPTLTGYNYLNIIQAGLLMGGGNSFLSFADINGFLYGEQYSVGIGAGLDFNPSWTRGFIPVFVDYRYYIKRETYYYYIFADAGYSIGSFYGKKYDISNGGLLFGLGVGMKIYFGRRQSFKMQIGYRMQNSKIPDAGSTTDNLIGFAMGVSIY